MTLAAVPNVNLNRLRRPSLRRAMGYLETRSFRGAELERDLTQATAELFGGPEHERDEGIYLPSSTATYLAVLDELAIRTQDSEAAKYAVRALTEGINSVTYGNTVGAALVPPQFLQDSFALALTANVVLKRMPDVETIEVTSRTGILPKESAIATTSTSAEAGALISSDPTTGATSWSLQKLIAFRTASNELMNDAPLIDRILNRLLSRDVGLLQDFQLLEGSGAGNNVTGIRNYAGLTTSSWVPATNGSTPTTDDLTKMIFDIYSANANPTAWIMHPRTMQKIALLKDSSGRPILSAEGLFSDRSAAGQFTYPRCAGLLLGLPVYLSTQVLTNETQGSSSVASHIIIGDFTRAKVLERGAVQLFLSGDAAFNLDETLVRAAIRTTVVIDQAAGLSVATGII